MELQRFQDALADSNKAIELNPIYAKAYLRKAEAERELLMNDQAIETLKKGLEIEENNEQLTSLYEESKREYEDDHRIAEDDPSKIIFNNLENWIKEGGAKYDKLKIRYYTPIYRGVHAAKNIKAGE